MARFNLKKEYSKTDSVRKRFRRVLDINVHCENRTSNIEKAVQNYLDINAVEIMKKIDTDRLKNYKMGIRTNLLKESGYKNLSELYFATGKELTKINGIGEQTAQLIKSITGEVYRNACNSVRLKISVDDKREEITRILREVYFYIYSKELSVKSGYLNKYSNEISEEEGFIEKHRSFISWTFASSNVKDKCRKGIELINLFYAEREQDICKAIDEYDYLISADDNTIYDDFSDKSVEYYSIIEKVSPLLFAQNITGLGITQELCDEIEKVNINLERMKSSLRGYQNFGVKYILKQNNVLLGDEMGLGKTVQAIAVMASLYSSGERHFLVICPSSVLENWKREIVKHSDLTTYVLYGKERNLQLEAWASCGGVAITTFEYSNKLFLPDNLYYALLCVDEAHYIKNPDAQRTKSVLRMKIQAKRTLFMSGTPIENKVDEMCFLIRCLNSEIRDKADELKRLSQAPLFREVVAPVYLRRTREDVLQELPELIESQEWCVMTSFDRQAYNTSVKQRNFTEMRKVSWNSPEVLNSSKVQRLLELCDEALLGGRKVIVFSFFRDTVETVCNILGERSFGPVTGSVPVVERQKIIDDFSCAPAGSVLVSQIVAGGTGLNIQTASVVIICEPQLKPSAENQAIARAYRMGQVRNVLVFRLLCIDSIDECLMDILEHKQMIFDEFAEDSVAGKENIEISENEFSNIIDREIERIKLMNASMYDIGEYSLMEKK